MATTAPSPSSTHAQLWRPVLALIIDYLRWTQLVPMVMAWAFLLIMAAALVFTNFQQQSFSVIEGAIQGYEAVFGPLETADETGAEPVANSHSEASDAQSGPTTFDEDDLKPWILKTWAALALAGWILGLIRTWLFGPRQPVSLPRKLARAAIAAGVLSAVFFACWGFGSENFNGGPAGWIALFLGIPMLVWGVSAWCLSVAHLLDLVARQIEPMRRQGAASVERAG